MSLCVYRNAASNGCIVLALDDTRMNMEHWWSYNSVENTEVSCTKTCLNATFSITAPTLTTLYSNLWLQSQPPELCSSLEHAAHFHVLGLLSWWLHL